MITAEGKCDGKCATCNIVQQSHCKLVQLWAEQDKALHTRLDRIEEAVAALSRRLGTDIITAQGGGGAEEGKASGNTN